MKLLVEKASDKVVGVHIVGHDAGEMIQAIGIAVTMGATKADFDRTIAVHPTAAEELVTMRTPFVVKSRSLSDDAGRGLAFPGLCAPIRFLEARSAIAL